MREEEIPPHTTELYKDFEQALKAVFSNPKIALYASKLVKLEEDSFTE